MITHGELYTRRMILRSARIMYGLVLVSLTYFVYKKFIKKEGPSENSAEGNQVIDLFQVRNPH